MEYTARLKGAGAGAATSDAERQGSRSADGDGPVRSPRVDGHS